LFDRVVGSFLVALALMLWWWQLSEAVDFVVVLLVWLSLRLAENSVELLQQYHNDVMAGRELDSFQ
jgi:hypothetical protein